MQTNIQALMDTIEIARIRIVEKIQPIAILSEGDIAYLNAMGNIIYGLAKAVKAETEILKND
jgi:hypothetical protein